MDIIYVTAFDKVANTWKIVLKVDKVGGCFGLVYTDLSLYKPSQIVEQGKFYYSGVLPPLLSNMILNSKRSEYDAFLQWIGINRDKLHNPFEILARTGGIKVTSPNLRTFAYPKQNCQGNLEFFFMVEDIVLENINTIDVGDSLTDMMNGYLNNGFNIGIFPVHLRDVYSEFLKKLPLTITVERINHDAPRSLKVLCKGVFKVAEKAV